MTHAVKVEMPRATSESSSPDRDTLLLSIDAAGQVLLGDAAVSLDRLEALLGAAVVNDPQQELHLLADRSATYDVIAKVMAAARRAGVARIGFVTQPERTAHE
jgi:biopolymer transport protein ExbD